MPRFEHDCEACFFIATVTVESPDGEEPMVADLYKHDTTYLARFSDDGPEYSSFDTKFADIPDAWNPMVHMAQAIDRHMTALEEWKATN